MTQLTDALLHSQPFILFENTLHSNTQEAAWLFTQPLREIIAHTPAELVNALAQIDQARQQGYYLAGYISYEAGYALSEKLVGLLEQREAQQPLLEFYVFDQAQRLPVSDVSAALKSLPESPPYIQHWQTAETEEEYINNLAKIHDYICAGDTYQVNHTYRADFTLAGSINGLYHALRERQPVPFSALMHLPKRSVLSLSPELFIQKQGSILSTKPMKGTAPRGVSAEEDEKILKAMAADKKQQSENLMIVDLMRNDIGRLANTGSMQVSKLFEIQTYKTLHQMISSIQGEVDTEIAFAEVIRGLFPCGSITGAPKIRTMEIIHELENTPRDIYTGAIGFITPENNFTFNVPIRTLSFDANSQQGRLGIGGGIIHESNAQDEWRESQLKARFLTGLNQQFKLIESLLYQSSTHSVVHLEAHLKRLQCSAETFSIVLDINAIKQMIMDKVNTLNSTADLKLRLLIDTQGHVSLEHEVIDNDHLQDLPKITLSEQAIDSDNLFRRHKTTNRQCYNEAYQTAEQHGFYDVLFCNQHGHIAEASRHNVFIEKQGILYTPPISDGALPGVMRSHLLDDPHYQIIEQSLTLDDLVHAQRLYLSNAVRGLVEVTWQP